MNVVSIGPGLNMNKFYCFWGYGNFNGNATAKIPCINCKTKCFVGTKSLRSLGPITLFYAEFKVRRAVWMKCELFEENMQVRLRIQNREMISWHDCGATDSRTNVSLLLYNTNSYSQSKRFSEKIEFEFNFFSTFTG